MRFVLYISAVFRADEKNCGRRISGSTDYVVGIIYNRYCLLYTSRNGIYIIDLQKTVKKLEEAYSFIRDISVEGKPVLFVGTKKQAQDSVKEEAERAGAYYVNARWLGGMMTNFSTIRRRVSRLQQLRAMEEDGTFDLLPKKEVIKLRLEIEKLEKFLGGIKEMKQLPGALFIVDPRKERIAVAEAKKLGIPIVAIVDTNCDPCLLYTSRCV